MTHVIATIEGMHCEGCEQRVETATARLEGVRTVEADHETGRADITFIAGQADTAGLQETIEELGFTLVDVEQA